VVLGARDEDVDALDEPLSLHAAATTSSTTSATAVSRR
jgi:hypothetical protein